MTVYTPPPTASDVLDDFLDALAAERRRLPLTDVRDAYRAAGAPGSFGLHALYRAVRERWEVVTIRGREVVMTGDTTPAPIIPTIPDASIDPDPEILAAIRARLARGELGTPSSEVQSLTVAERTALAAVLDNPDETAMRYDALSRALAAPADLFTSDSDAAARPSLGELGYGIVRAAADGSSVWTSDPPQHRQARNAAREAQRMREACVADAIRDARSDALLLGIFELDDATLDAARARGLAKAARILAALR